MKENWTYKKLGEVCEVLDSKRKPITKNERVPGNIPYYGATGIQDYVANYIFDGTYLLVGEDGAKWGANEKCAYIITGKSWVNNHAHVLECKNYISEKYIKYYLNFKDLDSYITGAIVRKLTKSALLSIDVPVPPVEEQERIVEELDLLSGIIEKQKQQLKELDTLAQSIFYDTFGDPITNEKNWPLKKLKEVSTKKLSYGSGASAKEYDGEVRYLRITDIDDDGSLKNNAVSPSIYDEKYLIEYGDILFARTGATVGKTYLHRTNDKLLYAGYLIRMKPNIEIVIPMYVFHFTKSEYYKDFIRISQKTVAQPNINAEQYGNLLIPIPPLSLQEEFAEKIEMIEKQKEAISKSIKETQLLFDYTMDKYFG
ncbi:MAG: restriction endonuclease subunit S [Muribaculaceae bacterium]|nr:restriction endonuclease subunit S [Muribaculaceae bacterium]